MNKKTVTIIVDLLKRRNALVQFDDFCSPYYCNLPKRILGRLSQEELSEIRRMFYEMKNKETYS